MYQTQPIDRIRQNVFTRPEILALKRRDSFRKTKSFYHALLLTSLLPFLPYIFPFMPSTIAGLNITGWAWTLMLIYTLMRLPAARSIRFPLKYWLPWGIYLIGYLIYDYSYLGLQLTCQYLLPIMIGVVASSFSYNDDVLRWIFNRFSMLCLAVIGMFVFGYIFRGGYTPAAAATPMLISILVAIASALYYTRQKLKYLLYYGALFLIPFIDLTRTGIAVFIAIFVLHLASRRMQTKIWGCVIGTSLVLLVFNSSSFQEKTFYTGEGSFGDIQLNYYESERMNTSGRSMWKRALEPGLEASPIFGNGPRADNEVLSAITGMRSGEAHNDYLSVAYNYGYFGLALLLGGFVMMFLKLRNLFKTERNFYRYILITSTMTLFIGFGMFMYTDNIMKYTIYFPNMFFAMAGAAFADYRQAAAKDQSL